MKKLCLLLVLVSSMLWVTAQDIAVSGKVLSSTTKKGIEGLTILVKGTNSGTATGPDGSFSINAPSNGTLVISGTGITTREVAVNGQNSLNVEVTETINELDQVVVTALGIQRQAKTLTYATQKVDGEKINEVRDGNFLNTLNGKVAGAVITQSGAGVGGASRIILRGNRSIAGNNNALIVLDGVPINNTVKGQPTNDFGGYAGSDAAANINPDDIESLNILKGPAAAALYGSQAANGVIIITTKKGKSGRISTSANLGVSIDRPFILPSLQDEYVQGAGGVAGDAQGSWGPKGTTYSDNMKSVYRSAVSSNASVGVSAGTEKVRTYFSYAFVNQQGIIPKNDLRRHTFNLRTSIDVTKRLSIDTRLTYINQDIKNQLKSGEEGSHVMNILKIPRSISEETLNDYETFDAQGQPVPKYWTSSSLYMNPYWTINRTSVNETRNRIIALVSAKYKLTDWLDVQGRINVDRFNDFGDRTFYNNTLLFAGNGGSYGETTFFSSEVFADFLLSGHHEIGSDWQIGYNLGAINQRSKSKFNDDFANGLLIPNKFNLGFATALQNSNSLFERELQGVYATAQISFRNWLNIDLTGRNDWSSTLPAPHSYFYPSVGANVILTDALDMKSSWLDFLKVRGSYTQVGNDAQPYLLQQTYSFTQGGRGGFIERDGTKLIPDLKPELTTSLEFGVESRFFDNRLGVDLTWYKSNTSNQLLRIPLPPATGFGDQYINAGDIQNSGLEVQLFINPIRKRNFNWDINVNWARNRNKVVELSPDIKRTLLSTAFVRTAAVVVEEGGAYGDLYGYGWAKNEKGNLVVDAQGRPVSTRDLVKLGNFNPDWIMGITNSFTLGKWSASVLIDGRKGGVMVSGTDGILAYDGNADYTAMNREGGWVLPADNQQGGANTVGINAETFWQQVSQGRYMWGEFFTYDATNFRLRELTFGRQFDFSGNVIKGMKLSLVARNLFFLYRGKTIMDIPGVGKRSMSFDPDINLGAGNYQGIEYGNLPSTRSVGLNLKFDF